MTAGIHDLQHMSDGILVHKVPKASENVPCSSCDPFVRTARERFHRNPPKHASARLNVRSAERVENLLGNVCPNCGGGFVPRPIRPRTNWNDDNFLGKYPPPTERRHRLVDWEHHGRLVK